MGSLDYKYDDISVDNADGNREDFSVGTSNDAKLGKFESNMLGVAESSRLGGEHCFK